MTKEELETKFEECFDANTRASEGGYGADTTDMAKVWQAFEPVILQYTKQQAIAFATHYAKGALTWRHTKAADVAADRMEERYAYFIENQFIEQQNK